MYICALFPGPSFPPERSESPAKAESEYFLKCVIAVLIVITASYSGKKQKVSRASFQAVEFLGSHSKVHAWTLFKSLLGEFVGDLRQKNTAFYAQTLL